MVLHVILCAAMKTNLTLRIEADLVRRCRVLAAREGTSISALLATQLERLTSEDQAYQTARRRAVARMRHAAPLHWQRPGSRDELHER
jgi:hypothetical protein